MLKQPQPEAVQRLLTSFRSGKEFELEEDDFYATALTASGGRAVIRDWLHSTVGDAKERLQNWFVLLTQVDNWGAPGKPLGIYQLASSLYRDAKDAKANMAAQVPHALINAALHGDPLPHWLLDPLITRCRCSAKQRVTYPRAALIKAVLCAMGICKEGSMEQLDQNDMREAYLCGRLLSILESVQRAAQGKINTTLVDRFYGAASTAPASVFGNLLGGMQPHLAKLRKTKPGTHFALQLRLEEIMANLHSFPRTLPLQDQALFSLGYYHQRAQDRAEMLARKAKGDIALIDIVDDHEEEANNE
jgi:CRISPR-associated protein Csd1